MVIYHPWYEPMDCESICSCEPVNDQFFQICASKIDERNVENYYEHVWVIYMEMSNERSVWNAEDGTVTGKTPFAPIMLARTRLREVMNKAKHVYGDDSHLFIVEAANERLQKIYEHFLPRDGFKTSSWAECGYSDICDNSILVCFIK